MKLKRNSVLFTWLISYILILSIPIVINAVNYVHTTALISAEINNNNNLLLKKVQNDIDNQLKQIDAVSYQLALNKYIQQAAVSGKDIDGNFRLNITNILGQLKLYKNANDLLDFLVYIKEQDIVVTSQTANNSSYIYDNFFPDKEVDYEQWHNIISASYKQVYVVSPIFGYETNGKSSITCIRPVPISGLDHIDINIMVSVNYENMFANKWDEELNNHGYLIVLNQENEVMISSNHSEFNITDSLNLVTGKTTIKLNGQRFIVSTIKSQVTDWKYIIITPETVFWEKAIYLRKWTLISLVLCIILGGIVAYMLSRKNYSPIKRILNFIENSRKVQIAEKGNEYEMIHQIIFKTFDENKEIKTTLNTRNNQLKSVFLLNLLKGKEREIPLEDSLAAFNISFESGYFGVIVFYFEKDAEIIREQEYYDENEYSKLMKFSITNVINELMGDRINYYIIEDDDLIVCLTNLQENNTAIWQTETKAIAEKMVDFFGKHFKVDIIAVLSSLCDNPGNISRLYSEVLEAMEYKLVIGGSGVIDSESIMSTTGRSYDLTIGKDQELINAIKSGDSERAKNIISDIFEGKFEKSILPVKIIKFMMFNLIGTILRLLDEISDICEKEFLDALNPVDTLLACETVQDMKEEMYKTVQNLCNFTQSLKDEKNIKLKDIVKDYVKSNYNDVNLNISCVAEHLQMHPVYVSKLFKEETGEGLLDYINRIRIEKAKQIMSECKMNMDDVAQIVGYSNVRTFRRLFAKYEGLTPGKYSKNI